MTEEIVREDIPSLVEVVAKRPVGNTIIETLVDWAESNGYAYEDIAKCLSPNIVQSIQEEAINLNMLKGRRITKLSLI